MDQIARSFIKQIIQGKQEEIGRTENAQKMSVDDAKEAEGAMISRYDTFLEEAQYLAGGQSKRLAISLDVVEALQSLLAKNPNTASLAVVGSIVTATHLSTNECKKYLMVMDGAGGDHFFYPRGGVEILSLSVLSPLGRCMFEQEEGDTFTFPDVKNEWEITKIL